MGFYDGVIFERVITRLLHQAQMLVAADHVGNAFYQLHATALLVPQAVFLADAGQVNRARGQPEQAQVVLLDRLFGVRLRIGRVQPL